MKLRISQNSIRLRLGQSEVAALAKEGSWEEKLELSPQSALIYRVVGSDGTTDTSVKFQDGALEVAIPKSTLREWALGNNVSLTAEQNNGAGAVNILIEKDFHCLHREASSEDADAYPNPSAA